MNFDDCEKHYEAAYVPFAATVRLVLEKAIAGTAGVPRPQSIQCRAKAAAHLKPKLEARGLLTSADRRWCGKLTSLGVELDEHANASNGPSISTTDSAVSVWVIPTNEERMIAQHTLALVKE